MKTPTIREEIQERIRNRQVVGSYDSCPDIYKLSGYEMFIHLNRRSRSSNPKKPSVPITSEGKDDLNPHTASGKFGPADGKET